MNNQFHQIIHSVFKRAFVFAGKESRTTFCCYIIFCVSCLFIYGGLVFLLAPASTDIINMIEMPLIPLFCAILITVLLVPFISLSYRRSTDLGQSFLFWLLAIPLCISIIMCVVLWQNIEMSSPFYLALIFLNIVLSMFSFVVLAFKKGATVK